MKSIVILISGRGSNMESLLNGVAEGTLPVRADVKLPERFKQLPSVDEAAKRALKIDYQAIMAEKEATVKKFSDLMQKK